MSNKDSGVAAGQLLLPLTMVSCAVLGLLAFNTVQIVQGHGALKQVISQQDKPLEEAKKIESQLTALALGTKKLADAGNGNAQGIVEAMQKAGITINDKPTGEAGNATQPQSPSVGGVESSAPVAPPSQP
ncbi:MAG: hypothetical protein ABTQ34_04235 [Bdellovibrionales bacterium]